MKTDAELEEIFRQASGTSRTAALRAIYHEGYEAAVRKAASDEAKRVPKTTVTSQGPTTWTPMPSKRKAPKKASKRPTR